MTPFPVDVAPHEFQVWLEPVIKALLCFKTTVIHANFSITFCLHSILSGSMASSVFARLFFTDYIKEHYSLETVSQEVRVYLGSSGLGMRRE